MAIPILPVPLLRQLEGIAGWDVASFLQAHAQPAATSVRLHPLKQSQQYLSNDAVPWCPTGRYLPRRPIFTLDPAYHAGAYYVQEASSMFLHHMFVSLLGGERNLRVLDLCAAPGGKSTLLASVLSPDSLLVSNEVIRTRASILEENMTRWGHMNTWVTSNDPRDFAKLEGYFDAIVVDAPCSGSGLFRKDAYALEAWSEANVQLCSQRQQRILADVWPTLKPGGILIYATCSYSPQEDEEILDWLGATYDVTSLSVPVADDWNVAITQSEKHRLEGYRFFPHRVQGEGFFIVAVRKDEATAFPRPVKFKSQHDKQAAQQSAHLLQADADIAVLKGKDDYTAILAAHEADYAALSKAVYLRKVGTVLGNPSHKDWLPAHEVALSIHRATQLPTLTVTKEQALQFLKKEDIIGIDASKGWHVITYAGLGLGWIKSLGNRFNNYLPKHWRIRMDNTRYRLGMIVELCKSKFHSAMFKYICCVFLVLLSAGVLAQEPNRVYVAPAAKGWQIPHVVQNGETVYMLARRYHVPPAILADANRTTFDAPLPQGSTVYIPIAAYNYMDNRPATLDNARTLYYKVGDDDNLYRLSRRTGVQQYVLQGWNQMSDNAVQPGLQLIVGWVLYDATPINIPPPVTTTPPASTVVRPMPRPILRPRMQPPVVDTTSVYIPMTDTMTIVSVEERAYMEQTSNGQNVVEEKGTAAFYSLSSGSNGTVYYAFHNAAAKGSIIKVINPGNGRSIFVKVIGTLPGTKQYHNSIIGISGNARRALGTFGEDKLWCELHYAGY